MEIHPTPLPGSFLIELSPIVDDRGYFSRVFCARELAEAGLETRIAQVNTAFNLHRGTIRGLHFQYAAGAEVKLVRCTRGSIFDVIVDVRKGSPTFGQWYGVTLSEDSLKLLYVPHGFAHGYQVLEDRTELSYFVSEFYQPGVEGGFRRDDPAVGIDWPITDDVRTSGRDAALPLLAEIEAFEPQN